MPNESRKSQHRLCAPSRQASSEWAANVSPALRLSAVLIQAYRSTGAFAPQRQSADCAEQPTSRRHFEDRCPLFLQIAKDFYREGRRHVLKDFV
jgi:hypothetical protein